MIIPSKYIIIKIKGVTYSNKNTFKLGTVIKNNEMPQIKLRQYILKHKLARIEKDSSGTGTITTN